MSCLRHDATSKVEAVTPDYEAPLFAAGGGPSSENDYLIRTRYLADGDPPFAEIEDVLRHCGIDGSAAYTDGDGIVVGATLDADQLAAVRRDLQVEYVERDCLDRVAPYFRNLGPSRIVGSYIVACVDEADVAGVAARHGIASSMPYGTHFAAELSDAQRDRLRHDAKVEYIQDNLWESVHGVGGG